MLATTHDGSAIMTPTAVQVWAGAFIPLQIMYIAISHSAACVCGMSKALLL